MLKNRRQGLLFLHGFLLALGVSLLFGVIAFGCSATGLIRFNVDVNWALYAIAVIIAMIWNQHSLGGLIDKLPSLGHSLSVKSAFHQVTRLMTVLFTLAVATQDVEMSRAFLAVFIFSSGVFIYLANLLLPKLLSRFLFRDLQLRSLVLTNSGEMERFLQWFDKTEHLGHQIVGWIAPGSERGNSNGRIRLGCYGSCSDLDRLVDGENVNHLLVNKAHFSQSEISEIEATVEKYGCRFHLFVDLSEAFGSGISSLEHGQRYAFATNTEEPLDNPVNRFVKRSLDLAISLPVVCFILPPLTLVVWIAQRFQSKGPVFHRQERSGLNRQRFHIFKFRTMHVHASEQDQARQATASDSRVFPFGRFMRKSSLDEFPQFINVLLGQMSVSGPRPHLIEHDQRFSSIVSSYYRRHFVKPGITGLAQSSGYRGEIIHTEHLERRLAFDLQYVSRWSLILDLRIILFTARQVVRPPKTAY